MLAVADAAAQLDTGERHIDAHPPGLGLGERRLQRVGAAVVGHPRGVQRQQPRGLVFGLELEQPRRRRRLGQRGSVKADVDPGLGELRTGFLERCPGNPYRHRCDERTRVVKRLHRPTEALLGVPLLPGAPQQRLLGHATALEPERRRIRSTDPELVVEPLKLEPRIGALDDERADRGTPARAVERGPDDDELGALAGRHEDLLAVEHVLVAVEHSRRAYRSRVRAGLGLGDRHRSPAPAVARQLLVARDGRDR